MALTFTWLSKGLDFDELPPANKNPRDSQLPHAPVRNVPLSLSEKQLAIKNVLRYFPRKFHEELAFEFAQELATFGHIYVYRLLPQFEMKAYPIETYNVRCRDAAAIMLMIMNNLDPCVAQYPQELVTYGGNGQVFSNWAQFWLVMKYLSEMTEEQTLAMYSGHPLGLFPSKHESPRVVVSNGMVIPNYSSKRDYDRLFALGVTMYGQMTAGSYAYIGPQGIVHGTTITVMNAFRKHFGLSDTSGKVFLSSGLGGMSGAQAKAAVICGCIGVIAEVNYSALKKRHDQGWLMEIAENAEDVVRKIEFYKCKKQAVSIGYHGNVVDLWKHFAQLYKETRKFLIDVASDQTSCHDIRGGGYIPYQLDYEAARSMLHQDPDQYYKIVQESLREQIKAINQLAAAGTYFFDYGNAFLLEAARAGADVMKTGESTCEKQPANSESKFAPDAFRYPSYVQHIMGDVFSLGFGPFRWVCTSLKHSDLEVTDQIAANVIRELLNRPNQSENVRQQYLDNLRWIEEAGRHRLVVGSKARILYSDSEGRVAIALAFNEAIREGRISGAVVISRDHHDVSGTDSPFRETSNIDDGSAFCADMAIQNVIGDAFRGATWVSLHNGGGVGFGEVINGGFGLLLDGSEKMSDRAKLMLGWDVTNGLARRCWGRNANAIATVKRLMDINPLLKVTVPELCDDDLLKQSLSKIQ